MPSSSIRSIVALVLITAPRAQAQTEPVPVQTAQETQLGAVTVEGGIRRSGEPLPDVRAAKINAGKKTTVTEMESLPPVTTNNYRQALTHTPGILTSEVSNQSFASFNYRGVGDPHESFNLLNLQDGLPLSADPYGYPASYYMPSLDYLDRIEFIRGGASLQYGPQPGGALNFVTREPSRKPFAAKLKQVGGEAGLFQTYNEVSGTNDSLSYLAQINHSQSQGFRNQNSDFKLTGGAAKIRRALAGGGRFGLNLDLYQGNFGEPGGFSWVPGPNLNYWNEDVRRTSLFSDRLLINRSRLELFYEDRVDESTQVVARLYGGQYERESRRQSAGAPDAFGRIATGATNVIANQTFRSLGAEIRGAHDWTLGETRQTLAGGVSFLGIDSPFTEEIGASPVADNGERRKEIDRQTRVTSVFVENKFAFGGFRLVPGARFESIHQEIDENLNAGATVPLRQRSDTDNVLLLGLGLGYDLPWRLEAYANGSQGFKPVTYADAVPLGTGDTISEDLREGRSLALEAGVRGRVIDPLFFDVSVFRMTFTDQFGRVGTTAQNLQNVGGSKHEGFETAVNLMLFDLLDQETGTDLTRFGELTLHANASFLSAEFTDGPLRGRRPQYAPRSLIRTGLTYSKSAALKVTFAGTFVSQHFANDSNAPNFNVAPYSLWDLLGETRVWNGGELGSAAVVYGVNNIFDRKYTARIRSNGIEPGLPRNLYAGLQVLF